MLGMPNKRKTPIHPSMSALYQAAVVLEDAQPAQVARRLDITPQRLQNWESRGISKEGALDAQRIYGVDATALRDGTLHWLSNDTATQPIDSKVSQAPRFDIDIIGHAAWALGQAFAAKGLPFRLEENKECFLQVYKASLEMVDSDTPGATAKLFDLAIRIVNERGGESDRRGDSEPVAGLYQGDVAGEVRPKSPYPNGRR